MAVKFTIWTEAMLPAKEMLLPSPGKIGILRQLPPPEIIWLDETESTHNLLKTPEYADIPEYRMIAARRQTAGRGQRGNSWESEPDKNLTFSLVVRPTDLRPSQQFCISEATALAVVTTLRAYGLEATVKWPNDIYVADSKICGILIDHSIDSQRILRTVISAGINANQLRFVSDAPNPVSIAMLTGQSVDLERLARTFMWTLREYMPLTSTARGRSLLHDAFRARLYRGDGRAWPFRDAATGAVFNGIIDDVMPDGRLLLRRDIDPEESAPHSYLFKEVAFII